MKCEQNLFVTMATGVDYYDFDGIIFYNSKFLKKVSFVRKDKQTNRQTDRQTYGQTDRQTDRQTNRETNILNHVVKTSSSAKPLKRLPHGNYIRIC